MTVLHYTANCRFKNLQPQMLLALTVALQVFDENGVGELWLTSVNDSGHSTGSLHFSGRAIDIRVKNIVKSDGSPDLTRRDKIGNTLKARLKPGFDVLYGAAQNHLDHIHIEYDPD